jgi:hypothetical protein
VPIYIDLQPAPQFDRSLVTYAVVNFNRVKDALARTGGRSSSINFSIVGPWGGAPSNQIITCPFRCNVVIQASLSYIPTIQAFLAAQMIWDGVGTGSLFENFFHAQFVNMHMMMWASTVINNQAAGAHGLNLVYITGGITSNSDSRFRGSITFTEV